MLFDAKDLAKAIVIDVTVVRYNQYKVRHTVGLWLIRLATWIMWETIEWEEDIIE